jgi:hypothetical protein
LESGLLFVYRKFHCVIRPVHIEIFQPV